MSYNVGLNIVETDGKATPSIQPAQTSVAAFLILSERGVPGEVRQVVNWSQFKEYFGSHIAKANGAYAVQGFFDNGGTMAYVVRMVNTGGYKSEAVCASVTGADIKFPITLTEEELVLEVDGKEIKAAVSAKAPARLTGELSGALPEAAELELGLIINGKDLSSYTFTEQDFPDDKMTPDNFAKAINREFTDIKATAEEKDGHTKLFIQTELYGEESYLKSTGSLANYLGIYDKEAWGSGYIADMKAAEMEEVKKAITTGLNAVGLHVDFSLNDGNTKITVSHSKPGKQCTIRILQKGVGQALGFDLKCYAGKDPIGPAAAFVKPSPGLKVKAGYRNKEDPGVWGNNLAIEIKRNDNDNTKYDLAVYKGDSKTSLDAWPSVETWPALDNWEHAKAAINNATSGSKYIMIESAGANVLHEFPKTKLAGGGDDDLKQENVNSVIGETASLFDIYDVQLVCCPESSHDAVIDKLLTYCLTRGDCMFVGHTPSGFGMKEAKEYSKTYRGDKVYGALYFPWIQVYDPLDLTDAIPKFIPPTGHVMGVYARTERERGIWKAPAGNAARIKGALGVQQNITDVEHTDLVKNGSVNAVRFISGQGIVIDSSRTLSTNTLWLYVNVRLLFNFVKSSLKTGLRWVVQEPNNEALWNKVKYNSVTPFLMGLWRQGAFGPGKPDQVFTVKVDKENNKAIDIQNGTLTVDVYFYPSRPAETIIITVGQQEGGASAGDN